MSLDTVLSEIKMGAHDGNLHAVHEAIMFRIKGGAAAFRWRIRIGDLEVTEDDITLGELMAVEKATGRSWRICNPGGDSAAVTFEIIRQAYMHRQGLSEDDATAKTAALSVDDLLQAVDSYEVSVPPLGVDGSPST